MGFTASVAKFDGDPVKLPPTPEQKLEKLALLDWVVALAPLMRVMITREEMLERVEGFKAALNTYLDEPVMPTDPRDHPQCVEIVERTDAHPDPIVTYRRP